MVSYSGLMPALRTTLPHISVSAAIKPPNSSGVSTIGMVPILASLARIAGFHFHLPLLRIVQNCAAYKIQEAAQAKR